MRIICSFLTVVMLAAPVAAGGSAAAEWVWDNELGWIDMRERPADSDRGLYGYARGLFIRGDYAAAADALREIEVKFPASPFAAKAKFGRAKCEERLGRLSRAVKICEELLAEETGRVSAEEVVSYQLEILKRLSRKTPREAADQLRLTASKAPTQELRYAAHAAEGDARFEAGDYKLARLAYEMAAEAAPDDDRKNAVLFKAALSGLIACREAKHDEARLRRAMERFREFLDAVRNEEKAAAAQQYIWAIENLLRESDPKRRAVFYAVTYLPEKQYDEAYPMFKRAAKKFRGTLAGETGRFYQAECLFLKGRIWKAFKVYETFLKEYAGSARLRQVVQREFAIGTTLADKKSRRKAIAVFEAVANNNPNGPLADDAEMSIGHLHMDGEHYDDARASFQMVAEQYPESEWSTAALFHSGVADLKDSKSASDNEEILARARRALEAHLRSAPDGPLAAEAQTLLRECDERQARVAWKIARFYERRKQPQAAAWYYAMIVREHPESSVAERANTVVEEYRSKGIRLP